MKSKPRDSQTTRVAGRARRGIDVGARALKEPIVADGEEEEAKPISRKCDRSRGKRARGIEDEVGKKKKEWRRFSADG